MAAVWHDNEGHLSVGVLKLPAELLRLLDADIGIVSSMKQKDGTLDLGDMSVRRAFTCKLRKSRNALSKARYGRGQSASHIGTWSVCDARLDPRVVAGHQKRKCRS